MERSCGYFYKLYRFFPLTFAALILVTFIFGCEPHTRDIVYTNYREGTIKRHIGKNGRYLQYVWLRTQDMLDDTQSPPEQDLPDVTANKRESQMYMGSYWAPLDFVWFPVAYYEPMKRTMPAGYNFVKRLGFMPTEPGTGRIPLYEWRRNKLKEPASEKYVDHYYSTDPNDPIARYRYQMTGIVGFVYEDDFPGGITLHIGYDEAEKNHILKTEKYQGTLKDFHRLGAIHASGNRPGNPYEFNEYRVVNSDNPYLTDNLYTAEWLTTEGSKEGFQTQWVVAGGGDNPLYQGGLALASFSLEHKHGVSQHSLAVAKRLFDFIEYSEELSAEILNGSEVGTGFLRRRRHHWWPHQYGNGSKWGASADELTGVIFGIKFFLDATANAPDTDTQEYHQRALALLGRIAVYLRDHYWVYVDTRVANNDPDTWLDEKMVKDYQMGTLAWQFAFSRVFKQYLGNDHIGDFDAIRIKFLGLYDLWFGTTGLNEVAEFITNFTCLKHLQLSYGIMLDDPYEVYSLLVQNMAQLESLKRGYCEGSVFEEIAEDMTKDFKYFNHAMLLYSAILVFETDDATVPRAKKKALAKHFIRYLKNMLSCSYGSDWFGSCTGPAAYNVLFAIVGKYAYQQVTTEEIADIFHVTNMRWAMAKARAANFERLVLDRIIDMSLIDVNNPPRYYRVNEWQEHLPLGHPKQNIPGIKYAMRPFGIGRNQAWEYPDMHFEMWDDMRGKTPEEAFKEVGPFYTGPGPYDQTQDTDAWSADATSLKLKEYVRVGRTDLEIFPGPGFNVEAGGNDYLLMRMLAVELGLVPSPTLVGEDTPHSVLPVDGASPW